MDSSQEFYGNSRWYEMFYVIIECSYESINTPTGT